MNPNYKLHHPRWHRPRTPIFWWLEKLRFTKFILRELTSLAVCYTVVLLLVQIAALSRGREAYEGFLEFLQRPPILALHVLVLLGLLFHTVTWLNLAPRALVLRLGRHRVSGGAVLVGHYLAWLVVTVVIVWGLVGR